MSSKLSDKFLENFDGKNFSSRTSYELEKFAKNLNNAKSESDVISQGNSATILKKLLKDEGVLNSEFDSIVNNIAKEV